MTGKLIRLRWRLIADPAPTGPQRLLRDVVHPLVWSEPFRGLEPQYYASRQWKPAEDLSEAHLTAVVADDRADSLDRAVIPAIHAIAYEEVPPTKEDRILRPDCGWYRTALQRVTDVALEVLASGNRPPVPEFACYHQRDQCRANLSPFLAAHSATYRGITKDRFWSDFFRHGPEPVLSAPGHWLWNIAG